jgi:hypothetical protein
MVLKQLFRLASADVWIEPAAITSFTPVSGPVAGGTQVTIAGTALGSGTDITACTVAGVAASINSQSRTQVVVTTGAAASAITGRVVLQSTSAGTITSTADFSYVAPEGT